MKFIKAVLNLCSIFLFLFSFLSVGAAISYVRSCSKSKIKLTLRGILGAAFGERIYPKSHKARLVCAFIAFAGFVNVMLGLSLASRRIGDFYELPSYTEDYEASLRVNHTVIDCIARVKHSDGNYFIDRLYLPFDHTRDIDIEYDAKRGSSFFCFGDNDSECQITLIKPATVISRANLAAEDIVSFGPYCASVYSSVYHLRGCPYTSGISSYSLRYFPDRDVAEVLGFVPCSKCNFY